MPSANIFYGESAETARSPESAWRMHNNQMFALSISKHFEDTDFRQTSKITRAKKKKYRKNLRSTFFICKYESIEFSQSHSKAKQSIKIIPYFGRCERNSNVSNFFTPCGCAFGDKRKRKIYVKTTKSSPFFWSTSTYVVCIFFSFFSSLWIRAVFEMRTAPLKRVFDTNPIATFERIAYFIFLCYSICFITMSMMVHLHTRKVKQCVRNKETKKKKQNQKTRIEWLIVHADSDVLIELMQSNGTRIDEER